MSVASVAIIKAVIRFRIKRNKAEMPLYARLFRMGRTRALKCGAENVNHLIVGLLATMTSIETGRRLLGIWRSFNCK